MDTIEFRLDMARRLGADAVISTEKDVPERLRELNDGRLADLVVFCYEKWVLQALSSVEKGGTVLFFAAARENDKIPLSVNELFWRTEITLTSSYAGPPADSVAALHLISSRRVSVRDMITHRLCLADTGKGFYFLMHPTEQNSMKIIIEPQR